MDTLDDVDIDDDVDTELEVDTLKSRKIDLLPLTIINHDGFLKYRNVKKVQLRMEIRWRFVRYCLHI